MAFLRINRFGRVKAKFSSSNQCKDVGHEQYDYHVAVTCCSTNTDNKHFIIDHADLHSLVQGIFQKNMTSCEGLAKKISVAVEKQCIEHKIHVVDVYVKIQPVLGGPTTNYAFMEYSKSGNFI